MKGSFYITVGGLLEVVWAVSMSISDAFTGPFWSVMTVVFIALSMVLLSKALSAGMPLGTAYAVWVGIGSVGTFAYGILFMDEPLSILRVLFVGMVIAGVIGLQMTSTNP
jgi:quaternary ammonium compound-resistance protein SugE